jgi:hypothetical protein
MAPMRSKDGEESRILKVAVVLLLLSPVAMTVAYSLLARSHPAPSEWPDRTIRDESAPSVSRSAVDDERATR